MLIMEYANNGNLHDYLQKNFVKFTWRRKIGFLRDVSLGYLYLLKYILFIIIN